MWEDSTSSTCQHYSKIPKCPSWKRCNILSGMAWHSELVFIKAIPFPERFLCSARETLWNRQISHYSAEKENPDQRWAILTPESESEPELAPKFTNLEPESQSEQCDYFKVESQSESESECQGGIGIRVRAGTVRNRPSLIQIPKMKQKTYHWLTSGKGLHLTEHRNV